MIDFMKKKAVLRGGVLFDSHKINMLSLNPGWHWEVSHL
jgi:hypothetical protein